MTTGSSSSGLNRYGNAAYVPPAQLIAISDSGFEDVAASLPALAAPESAQLHFTEADARMFKADFYATPASVGADTARLPSMLHATGPKKVRILGNQATKYFRKMFTAKDGTALVNCLDFSYAQECKIASFVYTGTGQEGDFHCDKPAYFHWKDLVAVGLQDQQLPELLSSPITSVKFIPTPNKEAITQRPGSVVSKAVVWQWIFEREDGTWFSLEPGSKGLPMKPVIGGFTDHYNRRKFVPNAAAPGSVSRAKDCGFLYGGYLDQNLRNDIAHEFRLDRIPEIKFHPRGWCDDNPVAHTAETWLVGLYELCKAARTPTTLAIHVPGGSTHIMQPADSDLHAHLEHSLTQMPALAADPQPPLTQTPALAADPQPPLTQTPALMIDGRDLRSWPLNESSVQLLRDGRDLRRGVRTVPEPEQQAEPRVGQRGSSSRREPAQEQDVHRPEQLHWEPRNAAPPSGGNGTGAVADLVQWWSHSDSWWSGDNWSS